MERDSIQKNFSALKLAYPGQLWAQTKREEAKMKESFSPFVCQKKACLGLSFHTL
jgi:hypothetical protein